MAINSLEFATKFTGELDKKYIQECKTGFLADNAMRAKFVGARTVKLSTFEMNGLVDYDRDKGFATGALTVASEAYTLTQDRAKSFMLDREDNDETGIANLAGQVLGDFVKYHVAPETDAYVLSKLYALSTNGAISLAEYDGIFKAIIELQRLAFDACGDDNLVAFVTSDVMAALETDPLVSRSINIDSFKQGGVDMKVKRIDNTTLIPVTASRMKTAYTFASAGEGGFTPTGEAQQIKILIMPKNAASLVKKSEKMRIFNPEQNQQADAYKFDYRLYYDVIVPVSKQGTIFKALA